MEITLSRTGDAPLKFSGARIAKAGESKLAGRDLNRWTEICLYGSEDARYVLSIEYHTQWQGELNRSLVVVCSGESDVSSKLREYDPVPEGVGYPPGDAYEDRQARVVSDLRLQYAAAVTELLDSDDRFAVGLGDAEIYSYAQMDYETMRGWVRQQLSAIELTTDEACAICEANSGAIWMDREMSLHANIYDAARLGIGEKWHVDADALAAKVRDLSPHIRFALSWAICQFWRRKEDTLELLVELGFVRPEKTA